MKLGKWCPNGCGKCVSRSVSTMNKAKKPYYCPRCEKSFTKKQLKKVN